MAELTHKQLDHLGRDALHKIESNYAAADVKDVVMALQHAENQSLERIIELLLHHGSLIETAADILRHQAEKPSHKIAVMIGKGGPWGILVGVIVYVMERGA
jgi:hypothetical protein